MVADLMSNGNGSADVNEQVINLRFEVDPNVTGPSYQNIAKALKTIFQSPEISNLTKLSVSIAPESVQKLKKQIDELISKPLSVNAVINPVKINTANIGTIPVAMTPSVAIPQAQAPAAVVTPKITPSIVPSITKPLTKAQIEALGSTSYQTARSNEIKAELAAVNKSMDLYSDTLKGLKASYEKASMRFGNAELNRLHYDDKIQKQIDQRDSLEARRAELNTNISSGLLNPDELAAAEAELQKISGTIPVISRAIARLEKEQRQLPLSQAASERSSLFNKIGEVTEERQRLSERAAALRTELKINENSSQSEIIARHLVVAQNEKQKILSDIEQLGAAMSPETKAQFDAQLDDINDRINLLKASFDKVTEAKTQFLAKDMGKQAPNWLARRELNDQIGGLEIRRQAAKNELKELKDQLPSTFVLSRRDTLRTELAEVSKQLAPLKAKLNEMDGLTTSLSTKNRRRLDGIIQKGNQVVQKGLDAKKTLQDLSAEYDRLKEDPNTDPLALQDMQSRLSAAATEVKSLRSEWSQLKQRAAGLGSVAEKAFVNRTQATQADLLSRKYTTTASLAARIREIDGVLASKIDITGWKSELSAIESENKVHTDHILKLRSQLTPENFNKEFADAKGALQAEREAQQRIFEAFDENTQLAIREYANRVVSAAQTDTKFTSEQWRNIYKSLSSNESITSWQLRSAINEAQGTAPLKIAYNVESQRIRNGAVIPSEERTATNARMSENMQRAIQWAVRHQASLTTYEDKQWDEAQKAYITSQKSYISGIPFASPVEALKASARFVGIDTSSPLEILTRGARATNINNIPALNNLRELASLPLDYTNRALRTPATPYAFRITRELQGGAGAQIDAAAAAKYVAANFDDIIASASGEKLKSLTKTEFRASIKDRIAEASSLIEDNMGRANELRGLIGGADAINNTEEFGLREEKNALESVMAERVRELALKAFGKDNIRKVQLDAQQLAYHQNARDQAAYDLQSAQRLRSVAYTRFNSLADMVGEDGATPEQQELLDAIKLQVERYDDFAKEAAATYEREDEFVTKYTNSIQDSRTKFDNLKSDIGERVANGESLEDLGIDEEAEANAARDLTEAKRSEAEEREHVAEAKRDENAVAPSSSMAEDTSAVVDGLQRETAALNENREAKQANAQVYTFDQKTFDNWELLGLNVKDLVAPLEKAGASLGRLVEQKEKLAQSKEPTLANVKQGATDAMDRFAETLSRADQASVHLHAEWDKLIAQINNKEIVPEKAAETFRRLTKETLNLERANRKAATSEAQLSGLHVKGRIYYDQYAGSIAKIPHLNEQWQNFFDTMRAGALAPQEARVQLNQLMLASKDAGVEVVRLSERIKGSFMHRIGFMISSMTFGSVLGVLRKIYSNVTAIDSAMTQLRIITQQTESAYVAFGEKVSSIAKDIGRSVTDVISSAETWARLGYSLDESATLAGATGVFANIAAVSENEATTSLTSVLKAYDYTASDAMHIVDILTQVGQKYAISASELGTALTKGGAALATAGNTLEESVALMAAGNAAVQNAETVGTALKTTTLRLAGSKADLEEMGEDVDALASSTSKMRKEILALSGVDIMKDAKNYKSTFQILKEIAAVWDKIDNVSQMTLLEDLAGKRNASVIASVINNLKDLNGAYADASNSTGVAEKAQATYMDSVAGKQAKMAAQFQDFSQEILDSGIVKGVMEIGNAVLWLVTQMSKLGALLPAIIASLTTLRTIKTANALSAQASTLATTLSAQFGPLPGDGDARTAVAKQYAEALSATSARVQKLTLDTLNLNQADRELIQTQINGLSADSALRASRGLTSKQAVIQIMETAGLNQAEIANILTTSRLSEKTRILTQDQRQAAIAALQDAAAQEGLKEAQSKQYLAAAAGIANLGNESKKAGGGLKALWAAFNTPMGWISAILTFLPLVIKGVKALIKTQADYIEKADQTIEELQQTKSSLDDNISKYDELIARRRELELLGNAATLTETQEKDAIDAKVAALERENAILRENLELQTAGAKQAIVDAYGGVDFEKGLAKASAPGYRHDGKFSYFATSSKDLESALSTLDNRYQVTGRTAGRTLEIGEAKQYLEQLNQWAAGKDLSDKELKALGEARDILTRWRVGTSAFNDADYISWILGDTPSQLDDTERTQALIDAGEYLTKLETQLKEAGAVWQKNGGDQELNEIIEKVTLARDAWMVATDAEGAYQQTFEHLVKFGKLSGDDISSFLANPDDEEALEKYTLLFATLGITVTDATDIQKLFNAYLSKTGKFAQDAADGLKGEADAIKSVGDAVKALQDPVATLQKAEKEMADTGYLSYETYQKLLDLGLDEYIIKVADGYKLANNSTKTYIEKRREQIKADRDAAAQALKTALAQVAAATAVQAATTSGLGVKPGQNGMPGIVALTGKEWDANAGAQIAQARKTLGQWQSLLDEYNRLAATFERDGAGGGGSSSSNEDPFLKQWEDVNAAMKHEVEMGKRTQASYMEWLRVTTTRGVAGSYLNVNEETYKKYYEKIRSVQEEVRKYDLEQLDKQKDAFESLVDFRIKQLEEETKKQKEELDKRKENLEDFYDKQIEMLEEQFDEEDYLEEQAEKREELANMRRQMDMLERDDSAWAKKRLAELKDEYADAEEDYRKWERDHAREAVTKTLEDERDAAVKEIEDTLEALDKQSEDQAALRRQAIADILSGNASVMQAMEAFSIEQGSWLEDNIVEKWKLAHEAVTKYGRDIAALSAIFGADRADNETYRFLYEVLSGSYQQHAAGTPNARGGWAVTQENGPEAILRRAGGLFTLLNPGDKVLNAGATNFLYAFANNPGAILASSMSSLLSRNSLTPAYAGMSGNSTINIDTGDVIIQGNADEKTVSEFRREKRKLVNEILQEFKKLR